MTKPNIWLSVSDLMTGLMVIFYLSPSHTSVVYNRINLY